MDVNLVNPFIEATLNTLETTAALTFTPETAYHKKNGALAAGDVSGLIRVSGSMAATVSLSFTTSAILNIVSAMFGEEMTELDDEIRDAVGEIVNMICGQANLKIGETHPELKSELQSVLMTASHSIPHIGDYPVLAVPFSTPFGPFELEFCFKKEASA
ncbi:MAG: chemotaxis protein CheX [Deltaproteobacteria bacterium]|nr:MAG: chemotaxis protein CheX [Deltaproteobacteria bacterium]